MARTKKTSAAEAPQSLAEWGAERDEARFTENATIARAARTARAMLQERDKELQDLRLRLGLYEQLEGHKLAPPKWLAPKKVEEHHAVLCLLVTDVHWDEVVNPAEVEGANCYNRAIAEMRLKRAFTGAVKLARNYFAGVTYDGVQLFLGGDLLSGIIHEELTETNQGTLCESILTVVEPLEAGITLLADEFGAVNVTAVTGNHGRRTKKPRSKYRAKDNFDWLVYQLVARHFRDRPSVTMHISEAADAPVTVYDTRYRLTHGDQFRGGSGISAELAPLLLGVHRKTRRQAALSAPFDVMVMGHFHQTVWLPSKGLIMGGSVVGYNEYAYASNQSPEAPQASLWLTTPEHGITLCTSVFLQDRAAEGW